MKLKPHMSDAELRLLEKYTPVNGKVLEFGAGGSSHFFAQKNVTHLTSVESDVEWIRRLVRESALLKSFAMERRWKPIIADIGPVKQWGYPLSEPSISWLNYHQLVWDKFDSSSLDFVLIDGRFRVACALQLLLRAGRRPPLVFMHDFASRSKYQDALLFFKIVDSAEDAVILNAKKNISWRNLALVLQKHQFETE